ncbi:MAG: LytR C-terminal domain-containing protein [Actinomycetota bacterium]|nr:LytR C-terminal domain-containing protein [Actinomycetota bacterium]
MWRTSALVAAAVAAFELVLLALIVLAFTGNPLDEAAGHGTSSRVAKKTSPREAGKRVKPAAARGAPLPRTETSVIVLNGNGIQGAAAEAAERARRFHYLIAATGNAPERDFAHSLVMFRRGYRAEAVRLARDLDVGRVVPLDGLRAADLEGAHLALIVGAS